ncbi:DUF881 domain-containing protein [Planosporangium thailandense]|uniref:DUF881 domain-containing protein n=1 Tax=Planosporangium thailandense TaxID=765197 RepID=A0ABX0Y7L3_9ACTN|nr:DUF881 domain-containing protein [Planosporangium thailandense]NJC74122.1 DUF881 domain-containing protein [Planosporangium thailandense]
MSSADDRGPGTGEGTPRIDESPTVPLRAGDAAVADAATAQPRVEESVTVPIAVSAPGAGEGEQAGGEDPGGEYEPAATGGPRRPGRRFSSAGAVIGLLLGLLGFALVVQLRSHGTDPELATARPEDLVRMLSDLDSRSERLRQEIASLEASQRQLTSGAQNRATALAEARRRADELGILAGTLPARGPGLEVKFVAGSEPIAASTVLDAVEELRGAGAEAMQIGGAAGTPVRIVASTYFADSGGALVVDGTRLTGPYTLLVIGDPQTMHTALNIPGGVVDTVHQHGGNVIVQESGTVGVTALHQVSAPRYARPVS